MYLQYKNGVGCKNSCLQRHFKLFKYHIYIEKIQIKTINFTCKYVTCLNYQPLVKYKIKTTKVIKTKLKIRAMKTAAV